jgi:7-cyano-7-deazaguanine synthase
VLLALTVDFGQLAAGNQAKAAGSMASTLNIDHRIMTMPWLSKLQPAGDGGTGDAETGWAPNRLGVLVNAAAAFADSLEAGRVVVGFHDEVLPSRPGAREEFLTSCSAALAVSTRTRVKVVSHTAEAGLPEIAARALELALPLEDVWMCERDGLQHCGACAGCLRLRGALLEAGVPEDFHPSGLDAVGQT